MADEFDLIKKEVEKSNAPNLRFSVTCNEKNIEIANVLLDCYEFDENEVPARYRLKYLDKIFPDLNINVNF